MATREEIDSTYNYMDELWRLSFGENADISGAMYNGDYSKPLEQAQKDKQDYILTHIGFSPGCKVLDIGCGWGGFLKTVRERGGSGIGLTLSSKQWQTCRSTGLTVYLLDWKDIAINCFGIFDSIVSVGAFEHFCSEDEYVQGKQEQIYENFFSLCRALLPEGRMYLQTMTWGRRVPEPETITLNAKKGSDEYILAVIRKFYPGSWLPSGVDQIIRTASNYFDVISVNNGRKDYVETMNQWSRLMRKITFHKVLAALRLSRYWLTDQNFRYRLETLLHSYNQECFRRELMDHQRLVLQTLR